MTVFAESGGEKFCFCFYILSVSEMYKCVRGPCAVVALAPASCCVLCSGWLSTHRHHFLPGLRQLKARWRSQIRRRRMAWIGLPGLQSPLRIIPEKICSSFEKILSQLINEVKLDHAEKKWATWNQSLFSNGNAGMALFLLKCIRI